MMLVLFLYQYLGVKVYVPDLIVFQVFESHLVQPGNFFFNILIQREEDSGAVDPGKS